MKWLALWTWKEWCMSYGSTFIMLLHIVFNSLLSRKPSNLGLVRLLDGLQTWLDQQVQRGQHSFGGWWQAICFRHQNWGHCCSIYLLMMYRMRQKGGPRKCHPYERVWLTPQSTELQSRGTLQGNRTSQSCSVILWLHLYIDFCNVRNLICCCIILIVLEYVTNFNICDHFTCCSFSILACNLALSKICHPLTIFWQKLDSPFWVFMYLVLHQNVFCESVFSWL